MSLVHPILAAAPAIDIDGTAFVQAAILLALMLVLKPLLFDPWIEVHERRRHKIDGAFIDAKGLQQQADALALEYTARLGQAKEKAVEVRSKVKSDTENESAKLLGEARLAANKSLDTSREAAIRDARAARDALVQDVDALALDVVTKVLGRSVS